MVKKIKGTDLNSSEMQTENVLENDLKYYGYLLPTNDEELEEFEKIYGNTQVTFPEELRNPDFIFKKKVTGKIVVLKQKAKTHKNNNDYFRNVVLAAEIANQLHMEPTFGHKKFVKIKYLCEEVCNMELSSNYGKYAAGPLDPKSMYSIDTEFKKQKWFNIIRRKPFGYKYEPLDKVENYKQYYSRYFGNDSTSISRIIDLFRKQKSDFCEKVATLFFVWKENLEKNFPTDESALFQGFYNWDESKSRFSQTELTNALKWMRENDIVPRISR